jgi:hypothetical protein
MILIVIGAGGFLLMRVLLMLENRRRARVVAGWSAHDFETEKTSEERRGDMKVTFRYGY